MILSDWKDVAGAKRAHTLSVQLNGMEVQRLTLKEVTVNAPIPPNTFAVNDEVKLTELAPNVQHVVGGTHNSLIVAMKDGIVVFDAPISEGQSRWVIDAAKAKYPGKPIKQLVLTHHHMDHSSGARTYVAEGAEIVMPAQARPFFEQMFQAEHQLSPDALAHQP